MKIDAEKDGRNLGISSGFGGKTSSDSGGLQYYTYRMKYTFDGLDSDFTFAITAEDQAGNRTGDDQVDYGSASDKEAAKRFTIDQVKPVIRADLSGEPGDAGYYRSEVTVTVSVKERNFDPARFVCEFPVTDSVTGKDRGSMSLSPESWRASGDSHTAVITCSEEGVYRIAAMKIRDQAGNESAADSKEPFAVDLHDPQIRLCTDSIHDTELDHTAKSGIVTPCIIAEDTNYSRLELNLTR